MTNMTNDSSLLGGRIAAVMSYSFNMYIYTYIIIYNYIYIYYNINHL